MRRRCRASFDHAGRCQCNPALAPILIVLAGGVVLGIIAAVMALAAIRRRGYVLAVVDVVHTANLGYATTLGISFVRDPDSGLFSGIVPDQGSEADIRIRLLGHGRFAVTDRSGRRVASDGEPVLVANSVGGRHQVVLYAFNTRAASPVTSRQ